MTATSAARCGWLRWVIVSFVALGCVALGTILTPFVQHALPILFPPAISVSAATRPPWPNPYFPLGVFEDGNMVDGDRPLFQSLVDDIKARGFDTVFFTNNHLGRDAGLLTIADEARVKVFFAPGQLNESWWDKRVPVSRPEAESVIRPTVERLRDHPSLGGYAVIDEPTLPLKEKLAVATDLFETLDPTRPAVPTLVGVDRVGPLFSAAQPRVLLLNVYPAGRNNAIGDFTMTGLGYRHLDFLSYIRTVTQGKPPGTPLWLILQTHEFQDLLREPVAAEVRAQSWLAVGEGATGIFWFAYSSQQGWKGLVDNPSLYEEVTTFVQRVKPLRSLLLTLRKTEDRFSVSGPGNPYVSTLTNDAGDRWFAVVVNRDLTRSRTVRINSTMLRGQLRILGPSPCAMHALGEPIELQPGDGYLLELVPESARLSSGSVGVPSVDAGYGSRVESWWQRHPMNPEAPCSTGIGEIPSPDPVVNVARAFGGSIQAAIDALPTTGGTLFLEPGQYAGGFRLVGRSNVHFISNGGAVIDGGDAVITGCPLATDYPALNRGVQRGDRLALICATTGRAQNVYFRDVVFDGNGAALQALSLLASRDVVFDRVTFRNFHDPLDFHRGLVSGSGMLDNIWFRGSRFEGRERYALYLDGVHGSGVVNSTVDYAFGSGGLLFLANDDFTEDYNRNGVWEPSELRISNYVVVSGTSFGTAGGGPDMHTAVSVTGANALLEYNEAARKLIYFAEFPNRCSLRWPELSYEHYGHQVIGNRVQNVDSLVLVNGSTPNCRESVAGRIGQYEIRENLVSGAIRSGQVVTEVASVDGPNFITNNLRASGVNNLKAGSPSALRPD